MRKWMRRSGADSGRTGLGLALLAILTLTACGADDDSAGLTPDSTAPDSTSSDSTTPDSTAGDMVLTVPAEIALTNVSIHFPVQTEIWARNVTDASLTITRVAVTPGPNNPWASAFTVGPSGEQSFTLPAGQTMAIPLTFAPTSILGSMGPTLGEVTIGFEGATAGEVTIPITGLVRLPELSVTPAEIFAGSVTPGGQRLPVMITNVGPGSARVSNLAVTGAPVVTFDPPVSGSWEIAPGSFLELTLAIDNETEAPAAWLDAALTFDADHDGSHSTPIRVRTGPFAECRLTQLTAPGFGDVAPGESATRSITFENTGSAPCSFGHARVVGVHNGVTATSPSCHAAPEQIVVPDDANFSVSASIPTIQDGIKPGDTVAIDVTWTPPAESLPGLHVYALLEVVVFDYNHFEAADKPVRRVFPTGPDLTALPCNLTGQVSN